MSPDALQDRSERLASLIDGLSAALRSSGFPEDAASRVLASASTAVLDALTLDLMLPYGAQDAVAAPEESHEPDPALPLAA